MTKNLSTPLQGNKSPWLLSAKANEFTNYNISTPRLSLLKTKLNYAD